MTMIEGYLASMSMRSKRAADDEDREALRQKRQWEAEDRAHTMSERARAVKMRQDMGNAAAEVAPVEIKETRPDTMDNRDVGQAGEAPLPTAGYDVGGKRFTDAAAAKTAATAQNTPQAVTTRMADVAMRNGDPAIAQKLRTGAMEEQAAQLKLNDAMRADIDAKFNADLQASVTDFASLEKFMNDSGADGKAKGKLVLSPDGKSYVVNVIGPDGALQPTGKVIPNTGDGLAQIAAELARMPADKKLAHLHSKAMLERQTAKDANDAEHQRGMLKATQDRTAANIEIATIRAEAAAARRAAGAKEAGAMTLADLKDGHKGIASTLNADWKSQIETETDATKLKALKVARENEIATVQRLYTGAMTHGFALTPEQAIVAFRSGEVRSGSVDGPNGKPVKVNGIVFDGRFIPLADSPGAAPPGDAVKTANEAAPAAGAPSMADRAASKPKPTANSFAGNDEAFKAMPLAELKRYVAVGNAYAKRELAARTAGTEGKRKSDKQADDEIVRAAQAQGLSAE